MPQFIIPAIMAATAVAGTVRSFMGPGGSQPQQPSPAELTKQAVESETSNRKTATKEASQFLPMLQANTSGGLSPEAYDQLSANFSGNANLADSSQMQEMVAKFLGLDTGATFGGSTPFGSSSPTSPGLAG